MRTELHAGAAVALGRARVDLFVYLDTNVIIDIADALSGAWAPSSSATEDERRLVAAARLFFYGYRSRNQWYLVTSNQGIQELTKPGGAGWGASQFHVLDFASDAPGQAKRDALAERYVGAGLKSADARHLAAAALSPWVLLFVTSDKRFFSRSVLLCGPDTLAVVTPQQAEALLDIAPGEVPPISPAPSSPLAAQAPWWIPN